MRILLLGIAFSSSLLAFGMSSTEAAVQQRPCWMRQRIDALNKQIDHLNNRSYEMSGSGEELINPIEEIFDKVTSLRVQIVELDKLLDAVDARLNALINARCDPLKMDELNRQINRLNDRLNGLNGVGEELTGSINELACVQALRMQRASELGGFLNESDERLNALKGLINARDGLRKIDGIEKALKSQKRDISLLSDILKRSENFLNLYAPVLETYKKERETYLVFPDYTYEDAEHFFFKAEEYLAEGENTVPYCLTFAQFHTAPSKGYLFVRGWGTRDSELFLEINGKKLYYAWNEVSGGSEDVLFVPVKKGDVFMAHNAKSVGKTRELRFFPCRNAVRALKQRHDASNNKSTFPKVLFDAPDVLKDVMIEAAQGRYDERIQAIGKIKEDHQKKILFLSNMMKRYQQVIELFVTSFELYEKERKNYISFPDYVFTDNNKLLFNEEEYVENPSSVGCLTWNDTHCASCNALLWVKALGHNGNLVVTINGTDFCYGRSSESTEDVFVAPIKKGDVFAAKATDGTGSLKDLLLFPSRRVLSSSGDFEPESEEKSEALINQCVEKENKQNSELNSLFAALDKPAEILDADANTVSAKLEMLEKLAEEQDKEILLLRDMEKNYEKLLKSYREIFELYERERPDYVSFPDYAFKDTTKCLFAENEYVAPGGAITNGSLTFDKDHRAPCNGHFFVRGWNVRTYLTTKINEKTFCYSWSGAADGAQNSILFPVQKGDIFSAQIPEGCEAKELRFFPDRNVDIKALCGIFDVELPSA